MVLQILGPALRPTQWLEPMRLLVLAVARGALLAARDGSTRLDLDGGAVFDRTGALQGAIRTELDGCSQASKSSLVTEASVILFSPLQSVLPYVDFPSPKQPPRLVGPGQCLVSSL